MSDTVIKVENLSKLYRLGEVGTGTLSHDLNRWWARIRGKDDPFAKVGQINDRTVKAAKGEYVWALKDINFEVKRGEVLGIIGKNGAGKSTLLKILSRITAPTTGEAQLKGRVGSLLEVGTGFHPEMTGRENIYMNGTILGMTHREITAKLDDIVDFAGVTKYVDTPVKRYSSGMMVRLGFAVAAFLEPEILIVDEVLAVGDAEFQKRAIGKMQQVSHEGGRTVLFVSHNMGSIQKLCDNGLLLNNGTIQLNSSITEVVKSYSNLNIVSESVFKDDTIYTNKDAVIREVTIQDFNGSEINTAQIGMFWKVNIRFEIITPLNHFIIALGIKNTFNTQIRTVWSKSIKINEGFYEISFYNDDFIYSSGVLHLTVGLSNFERSIHYVEDIVSFYINDSFQNDAISNILRAKNRAILLNPMKYDLKKTT